MLLQVLQDMQKKAREEQMEELDILRDVSFGAAQELRKAREDLQQHALEAARKDVPRRVFWAS